MGCAASAEGAPPSSAIGRADDSTDKRDVRKGGEGELGATTANQHPADDTQNAQANNAVSTSKVPPDSVSSPTVLPPITNVVPATIAGYPVNTYTDGTTRVAVKCVILSRQKCESICRFLDAVRKARERTGGVFRNPEEPVETEARRDVDTVSAASGRSKLEPSVVAFQNSSVTGGHGGMNVSMAVHVGHAHGPNDALSPSPNGGLAHAHTDITGTPGRSHNLNPGANNTNNNVTPTAQRASPQPAPVNQAPPPGAPAAREKDRDGSVPNVHPGIADLKPSSSPPNNAQGLTDKDGAAGAGGVVVPAANVTDTNANVSTNNNNNNTNGASLPVASTAVTMMSQRKEGGEPIPGSVDVDGAL